MLILFIKSISYDARNCMYSDSKTRLTNFYSLNQSVFFFIIFIIYACIPEYIYIFIIFIIYSLFYVHIYKCIFNCYLLLFILYKLYFYYY